MRGELLIERLADRLSGVRGKITPNAEMEKITWFRAGGLAEALFQPADEDDLAAFLKAVPEDVPVTVVGIGSNLLVREGGIPGFVVRLSAKGFGEAEVIGPTRIRAGAATPDKRVGPRSRHRRLPFLSRHSRRNRRCAADERRRQWRRDARARRRGARARPQGQCPCAFERRHGLFLPPFLRAGRPDLHLRHPRGLSGGPRRTASS